MVTVSLNLTEFQVESITLCLVHSYLVKKDRLMPNEQYFSYIMVITIYTGTKYFDEMMIMCVLYQTNIL
jgi:hypothetical protein